MSAILPCRFWKSPHISGHDRAITCIKCSVICAYVVTKENSDTVIPK